MSFLIDDEKLLETYKSIWTKIEDIKKIELNMLIRTYSSITNKNTRSFNMVLLGGLSKANRHIIKNILIFWLQFPVTIFREHASKNES